MLLTVLAVVLTVVYGIVLNTQFYTDRAAMPSGETRTWRRSPASRLSLSDRTWLLYLLGAVSVFSILFGILRLLGIREDVFLIAQIVSILVAGVLFAAAMLLSRNSHAKYA